jgi:hypothetical protein
MSMPPTIHWYWKAEGVGDHTPGDAVSVLPYRTDPLIDGAVDGASAPGAVGAPVSAKWMMPSGQPPPLLVTLRQSKAPLQFDSETQISDEDTTRSM